jgi:acetolactate synthase-1/2/3 large subunit
MKITGAQALIKSLEMEGVEVMFGLPGGCILPAYDPLLDSSIRHILVRHEQGAGHMAEGYAHVTGRPGVAMVTSGPAATNLVTPLCDAFMDSIPMVAITGQVPTGAIGTDAFQECDTVGITRSVTKHNELVMSAQDLPQDGRGPCWSTCPRTSCSRRWIGTGPTLSTSPATSRRRRAIPA